MHQSYSSDGVTFEDALKNAQNIHYKFLQKDSLLTFSPVLQLIRQAKWRDQEVRLTLKVPVGTVLNVSRDMSSRLNMYGYWDCEHEENSAFSELIMTDNGIKCKHEKVENMEQ